MGRSATQLDSPLAIVATAGIFPGSPAVTDFWRMIVHGEDQIREVPPHYWRLEDFHDPTPGAWGKTYAYRGGFVPEVDFDPLEFGIPPTTLPSIDTVQLLSLLVARDALAGCAAFQAGKVDRSEVGVILGGAAITEMMFQVGGECDHPSWREAMRDAGLPEAKIAEVTRNVQSYFSTWTENTFPGFLANVIAGRITNRLDLGGTNCMVDAACASSLAALSMAAQELHAGRVDMVLTGGSDAHSDIHVFHAFTKTPALSRTGDARPFSRDADGTILGQGVGLLAVRRLEDAERDGDTIHAVIRGIGSSSTGSDGRPRPKVATGPRTTERAAVKARFSLATRARLSPRAVAPSSSGRAGTAGGPCRRARRGPPG